MWLAMVLPATQNQRHQKNEVTPNTAYGWNPAHTIPAVNGAQGMIGSQQRKAQRAVMRRKCFMSVPKFVVKPPKRRIGGWRL
jgi:hypothetical protein